MLTSSAACAAPSAKHSADPLRVIRVAAAALIR
jgi:hypothetical protein